MLGVLAMPETELRLLAPSFRDFTLNMFDTLPFPSPTSTPRSTLCPIVQDTTLRLPYLQAEAATCRAVAASPSNFACMSAMLADWTPPLWRAWAERLLACSALRGQEYIYRAAVSSDVDCCITLVSLRFGRSADFSDSYLSCPISSC